MKSTLLGCLALLGTFVIEDPFYCSPSPDHLQLAQFHLSQGQFDQALMAARRAARQHRSDGTIYLVVAHAELGRGRPEEAFAALQTALALEPENEIIHAEIRQILVSEGRFDIARDIYSVLLKQFPDSGRALAGLGWAHLSLAEEEKALTYLEQAVANGDSSLFVRIQLSHFYAESDSLQKAIELLEAALTMDPTNILLLLRLGEYQLLEQNVIDAESAFARALAQSENKVAAATHIAQMYYAQENRSMAIAYYEKALSIEPQTPQVLNNLAWMYGEEGIELDRALGLSLQSVKAEADNVVYLDTYAELYYRKGRYYRAIALMRRALDLEPEDGENYHYLLEQMVKFKGAR